MSKYSVNVDELKKAVAISNHVIQEFDKAGKQLKEANDLLRNQSGFGINDDKITLGTQTAVLNIQRNNMERIRDYIQLVIDTTLSTVEGAKKEMESVNFEGIKEAEVLGGENSATQSSGNDKNIYNSPNQSETNTRSNYVNTSEIYGNTFDGNPFGKTKCSDGGWHEVYTNNPTGEIACTYFTMRKLAERGLAYPFRSSYGNFNGAGWYGNFDHDSGLLNAAGGDCLDAISRNGLPQYNIVVSMDKTYDGQHYGHVLLIDRMYEENGQTMIEFTDNYNWDSQSRIGYDDRNPASFYTGNTMVKSLEWFKQRYGGQSINGAVVVGK